MKEKIRNFLKSRVFAWSMMIGAIIIVICVIVGISLYAHRSTLAKPLEVPMVAPAKKGASVEPILANWIFNHSHVISKRTAQWIVTEAMKTNKPLLLIALMAVESEFNPGATSNVGAKGLTQVMWKTWGASLIKEGIAKEERDLYDIDTSVRAGNYVLDILLKEANGDVTKTLEKYLGGRDGYYKNRITENLANLYIATITAKE